MTNAAPLELRIYFPAPMHEHDVIGTERAIHDQLAAPMPVRFLLAQKIFLGARDRGRDFAGHVRVGFR